MVKFQFISSILLLTCSVSIAQKPPGSILRLKQSSAGQTDQIRILTKPRAGYNSATDIPTIYTMNNGCEESTAIDFIFEPIDEEAKCCKMPSLLGFNMWPEKQNFAIPPGANIVAQDVFPEDSACFERYSGSGSHTLQEGEVYNVYMAQAYSATRLNMDNLVEFHKYVLPQCVFVEPPSRMKINI